MTMEITFEGNAKVNAKYMDHVIRTDQPISGGGDNSAPAPFDLFLASMGTCAGIYVKIFCDRRNIPTENIKIIQEMVFDQEKHLVSEVKLKIMLPHDFPEKYTSAVVAAAEKCTVKRHLQNPPDILVSAVAAE